MRRCAAHGRIGCGDYGCVAADTAHHSRGHAPYDDGGYIRSGPGEVVNDTGRPEPVLAPPAPEVIVAVAKYGTFLATRRAAGHCRDFAVRAIEDAPATARLVLDFTGVEAVTGAFADELAGELYTRYGARLKLAGTNPEVLETVNTALQRRSHS